MTTGLADQPDLPLGEAIVRPSSCEILYGDSAVSVEPQVMRALLVLVRGQDRVVSRDALVAQAWDGRGVSEDAINRVISRIRRLSQITGAFRLSTLRKVGYRIEPLPKPPSEGAQSAGDASSERDQKPRAVFRLGSRRAVVIALVSILILVVGGLGLWRGPPAPTPPTIVVVALSAPSGDDADTAARLTAQLRATVSHMRGLRLVEAQGSGDTAADLRLSGIVTHATPQPLVALALNDQRSGARLWAAVFDGETIPDPTVEQRAVSATARYLAIWLGDRLAGAPTAREPPNPEAVRIVAGALPTLADAHEARHNRDWPRLARLVRETTAARDRALAIDPNAIGALMLGYQIEAMPDYPRPDETPAGFEARRRRAAQFLARALAADPDEPQALAAAAHEFTRDMRWNEAGKLLERAVAVDPNSADANTWYAYHLGVTGQCQAGLRYARIGAGLAPSQTWRQMAVPRLLHCAGRYDEAERAYRGLLARDPTNVFVLRDAYLMLLGKRDAAGLRALARDVRGKVWRAAPPAPIAAMLDRMLLAADALEGRPRAFLSLVDRDDQDLARLAPIEPSFGGSRGDQMFGLALEYAEAGATPRAMTMLRQAVEAGSLYFPWALPYGATEFPAALRADPAYAALWRSTPGLVALMARRHDAQLERSKHTS